MPCRHCSVPNAEARARCAWATRVCLRIITTGFNWYPNRRYNDANPPSGFSIPFGHDRGQLDLRDPSEDYDIRWVDSRGGVHFIGRRHDYTNGFRMAAIMRNLREPAVWADLVERIKEFVVLFLIYVQKVCSSYTVPEPPDSHTIIRCFK